MPLSYEVRRRQIAEAEGAQAGWARVCLVVRTTGIGEAFTTSPLDFGVLFFEHPFVTYGFHLTSQPVLTWMPIGSAFVLEWDTHERSSDWVQGARFGFVVDDGGGGSKPEILWHLIIQGLASKGQFKDDSIE